MTKPNLVTAWNKDQVNQVTVVVCQQEVKSISLTGTNHALFHWFNHMRKVSFFKCSHCPHFCCSVLSRKILSEFCFIQAPHRPALHLPFSRSHTPVTLTHHLTWRFFSKLWRVGDAASANKSSPFYYIFVSLMDRKPEHIMPLPSSGKLDRWSWNN